MVLDILTFPDPRLRRKGAPVKEVTPQLRELARNMLETMYDSNGIGLASLQVGEPVRLIVLDTRPKDDDGKVLEEEMDELERKIEQPLVLFNPEVTKKQGKIEYEEGCLSVPTFYEKVTRSEVIEVNAMNLEGESVQFSVDGLLAICIQHEIDHLDGKLFIDRLSVVKSNLIKNKIKKSGYPTPEEAHRERVAKKHARGEREEL